MNVPLICEPVNRKQAWFRDIPQVWCLGNLKSHLSNQWNVCWRSYYIKSEHLILKKIIFTNFNVNEVHVPSKMFFCCTGYWYFHFWNFSIVLMDTPLPLPLPLLHCNNKRLEWVLIIRLKVCEFRVLNLNHYIAVPNPD